MIDKQLFQQNSKPDDNIKLYNALLEIINWLIELQDCSKQNIIKKVKIMDRKSESSNQMLSRTNRQFYSKRKKQREQPDQFQVVKVLKTLMRKNQQYCYNKPKRQVLLTQNREQLVTKTSDKVFQLAQIKRVLQNNIKKVNVGFNKLLKSFQKCLNADTIEHTQFYRIDFYETFNQIVLIQLEKSKNMKLNNSNQNKIKRNQQNMLLLENMKLQKENILLRKQINFGNAGEAAKQLAQINLQKIKQFDSSKKLGIKTSAKQSLGNAITLQRRLDIQNQEGQIMKRQIQNYRQQIFLLRDQKKSLKQRINQLKIKNENLCSQIIGLQLNNKKTGVTDDKRQPIMMMQFEEIQSYRRQLSELKKLYLNLNKKYKGLIIKFKKTTAADTTKLGAIYSRHHDLFPEQFEAFQEVRGRIHNSIKIYLHPYNRQKKLDKSVIYQQFFSPKETLNNKDGIKKTYSLGMQYYQPTFYSLIAEDIAFFGIDQTNFEHFNQNIKLNFLGTLRAIMDSKFNQIVLKKQNQTCSSFPGFVLAWLNSYQINNNKKIQKMNGTSIATRQTICLFYANLMSQKLNNLWEVIAFRQFLLETFNNDQLYFYLSLRNFLIGGDMHKDISYSFEEVYYVDFAKVYSSLGKIIKENDTDIKLIYDEFLKRSIIYVRKKGYLDLHHVLRILLEYYQHLKQRQIQKILKTMQMIMQNRKDINLVDFQRIFDYHLTFLSHTQIIELFRRCFCVGNGKVNPDIVITVLVQQNIFLRWVDSFTLNTPFKIQQVKDVDWDINFIITPNINWTYENQSKFRFIYNTQLKRQAELLGIQEFNSNLERVSKLDSKTIFERLQLSFQICMMFAKKFYYFSILDNQSLKNVIQIITQCISNLSKATLRRNQIHQLMRDLKYKAASRKIVKFCYKKKVQMTRTILYAYSSDITQQQQSQKTQILREEFMQIIDKTKKGLISKKALQDQQG